MFDFEKITKRNTDKIIKKYNIDFDPIYTPRFKKFIKWFGYDLIPTIMNFTSFIILAKIFFTIESKSGIETVLIISLIMIVFSLRSIGGELKKLNS